MSPVLEIDTEVKNEHKPVSPVKNLDIAKLHKQKTTLAQKIMKDIGGRVELQKSKHEGRMRDHYRIIDEPLGKGAYGEVRKCYTIPFENMRNKSTCKQFRAVKVLSKSYMDEKA